MPSRSSPERNPSCTCVRVQQVSEVYGAKAVQRQRARKARAHAQPQAAAPSAHKPNQQTIPASCRNPASRHSRCRRERACRSGTGQNPLVEHAHTAPQPCSIAWEGGGHAAMKGGTPWSCERASGHVPASGARMSLLFTGKKPRGWPRGCAGGGTLHFTSARAQIAPDRPHPPSGALPHWGESDSRFFLPQFTFTFSRALDPNSRSIHA